jgi:zinc/manganese transport system permease protein
MSVGLIMLPAVAARHWSRTLAGQVRASVGLAVAASVAGLHLSYDLDLPTGPSIVLTAGTIWLLSLLAGPQDSLLRRSLRRPHLAG